MKICVKARNFCIKQLASLSPLIQDRVEAINEIVWWKIPHFLSGLSEFHEMENRNLILELKRIKPGAKTLGFVFELLAHLKNEKLINDKKFVIDGIIEYLELLDQIDQTLNFSNSSTNNTSKIPSKFADVEICYYIYKLFCKVWKTKI